MSVHYEVCLIAGSVFDLAFSGGGNTGGEIQGDNNKVAWKFRKSCGGVGFVVVG